LRGIRPEGRRHFFWLFRSSLSGASLARYSDTWQLVINTGTTIVTFLMVFLIQNTQNRDTLALQVKLSELILAMEAADNKVAAIEDASDEELKAVNEEIKMRASQEAAAA
jgi:low affinity Fe/Cu permease